MSERGVADPAFAVVAHVEDGLGAVVGHPLGEHPDVGAVFQDVELVVDAEVLHVAGDRVVAAQPDVEPSLRSRGPVGEVAGADQLERDAVGLQAALAEPEQVARVQDDQSLARGDQVGQRLLLPGVEDDRRTVDDVDVGLRRGRGEVGEALHPHGPGGGEPRLGDDLLERQRGADQVVVDVRTVDDHHRGRRASQLHRGFLRLSWRPGSPSRPAWPPRRTPWPCGRRRRPSTSAPPTSGWRRAPGRGTPR